MNINEIVLLILSGVVVGIINTLAGGGSVISMSLFMAMGLPVGVANGTNRIAVVMQNLSASLTFLRKRMLDVRSGLKLSIPAVAGNIIGSMVAIEVSETIFRICMGAVLTVILVYMIFDNRKRHIHGGHRLALRWWHYVWFFAIGFYGGYIYLGLGYVILAVTIWSMHLDIITANVVKGFVIFVSTPFALAVFMINGQVDYGVGLLHGAGNVIGALLASHFAIGWGVRFVRIFTLFVVAMCFADLVGIISLNDIISAMI